jgi:hypothetical protein
METGRVSSPIRTDREILAIYLSQRDPVPPETTASTLPKISAQLLNQRRSEIFRDWLIGRATLPENQLPSEVLMQLRGTR